MLFANVTDRKLVLSDLSRLNQSSTGLEGNITDLSAELILILRHLADSFTDSSKGQPLFANKDEVKNYFLELLDLAIDTDFSDPIGAILSNADATKERKFAICKSIIPFLPSPLDVVTPIILRDNDGEFNMEETVRFFDEVLVAAAKETDSIFKFLNEKKEE